MYPLEVHPNPNPHLVLTDSCTPTPTRTLATQVLEVIQGALRAGRDAQGVATALVEAAVELSKDTQRISPVVAKMNEIGLIARGREAQDDVTVRVEGLELPTPGTIHN